MKPGNGKGLGRYFIAALIAGTGLVAGAAQLAAQQQTTSPHGALEAECSLCHSARGWRPAHVSSSFDHGTWGFALEGAHATASCTACHASLEFRGTPTDCVACHRDVHRGELGAECSHCHTPRSFVDRGGMTQLHQGTRFPLEGVHRVTDCESCHSPGPQGQLTFVNRGAACEDCHLPSFLATTNPPHEASGFPRDCAQCHTATLWTASRYNHNDTGFPLTGRHRALPCSDCHANQVYRGAPTNCVGCHQLQYDATTNPPHAAAGFPIDCVSCHSTATWDGARFDHDASFFPIYSGKHRNEWTSCGTCHTNQASFAEFTCLSCHEHSQSSMNSKHQGESGYRYDSQACYSCHPRGTGDD